ncbi:MAG: hypothetical protein E7310_02580 [Clostridiales bacterium]|nr:hypothetical protein [Clostridiales bacterium]
MENASKALLMAGGILLAILLLSVGVLAYSKIQTLKTTEAEMAKNDQIKAFNAEYESYNRKLLRGIDVISVVNKAINNNQMQGAINTDPYYVNIEIDLSSKFSQTVEEIDMSEPIYKKRNLSSEDALAQGINVKSIQGKISIGTINELGDIKMNEYIIDFFNNASSDEKEDPIHNKIYIIHSGLKSFKSEVFTCTKVEYNSDGRVYQMTFKQK